jgi:sodium pump decarboxylase gamma subunit
MREGLTLSIVGMAFTFLFLTLVIVLVVLLGRVATRAARRAARSEGDLAEVAAVIAIAREHRDKERP